MFASATARRALLFSAILLTVGLAGCAADATPYGSYEDARDAATPGPFSPISEESQLNSMSEEDASNIQLKVLVPETNEDLEQGEQDIWILLYDEDADEPITDASVAIEAWMPHMDHGASPEEDPTHEGEGMYNGMTTWGMDGDWELRFDVTIGNNVLHYAPNMTVGESSS